MPLLNSHRVCPAENGPSRTHNASVIGLRLDTSLRKLSKSSALWSAKGNSALKFSQDSRKDAEFQSKAPHFKMHFFSPLIVLKYVVFELQYVFVDSVDHNYRPIFRTKRKNKADL